MWMMIFFISKNVLHACAYTIHISKSDFVLLRDDGMYDEL